jgi:hypothetical protein
MALWNAWRSANATESDVTKIVNTIKNLMKNGYPESKLEAGKYCMADDKLTEYVEKKLREEKDGPKPAGRGRTRKPSYGERLDLSAVVLLAKEAGGLAKLEELLASPAISKLTEIAANGQLEELTSTVTALKEIK